MNDTAPYIFDYGAIVIYVIRSNAVQPFDALYGRSYVIVINCVKRFCKWSEHKHETFIQHVVSTLENGHHLNDAIQLFQGSDVLVEAALGDVRDCALLFFTR